MANHELRGFKWQLVLVYTKDGSSLQKLVLFLDFFFIENAADYG
jgi:hypothetical protein